MIFDSALLDAIARLALAVFTALLGLIVLLRGRRLPWLFSGAAAFLLGVLLVRILGNVFGYDPNTTRLGWENLIPFGAAALGVFAGITRRIIALAVIGIAAGGALAIWVGNTFFSLEGGIDFWAAIFIIIMMALGALFAIHYGDIALIILSAGVGPALIVYGLTLPTEWELVAAFTLAAAIAGLVIQFHDYLVEQRTAHRNAETPLAAPAVDGRS